MEIERVAIGSVIGLQAALDTKAVIGSNISAFNNDSGYITGIAWGDISGTLSGQSDLQAALDLKSPLASPTFTGTVTLPVGLSGLAKLTNGIVSAVSEASYLNSNVTKSSLGLGNVENTALSTWAGSSSIDTLGTITTGVWSGTVITSAKIAAILTGKTLSSPVLNTAVSGSAIDTDVNLTANSDTLLASQKATKAYVDAAAGFSWGSAATGTTGNGISINEYGVATQATGSAIELIIGANFNTNSNQSIWGAQITNENNSGSGINTGAYIINRYTTMSSPSNSNSGAGLNLLQSGVDGTMINILTSSNINCSTYGLEHVQLSNTQSGATIMKKIDMCTSAQVHIGTEYSGSTSAKVFNIATNLTQAGGSATGTTTKEIKIQIAGVDYVIECKSQA